MSVCLSWSFGVCIPPENGRLRSATKNITPEMLRERDPRKLIPPLHGALLKNEQDVHLFERLAFLSRREV